jgi:diguanylate cyclase (GGDEF)-like protein
MRCDQRGNNVYHPGQASFFRLTHDPFAEWKANLSGTIQRALFGLVMPAAVLITAYFLVPRISHLPASLAGLRFYGTYIALAVGVLVSLAFNRGRVLLALLSLAIAYLGYRSALLHSLTSFPARTVFAALCIFVPLNLGILSALQERGTFNMRGLQRIAVIVLEVAVTAWLILSRKTATVAWLYAPLSEMVPAAVSPIPQLGLAMIVASLALSVTAWLITRSAIDLGFAGATVAFAVAANGIASPNVFAVFVAAAALILTIAVLQDTFRMAFRDELTGLPSRRALGESLAGLGRHYSIAMLDVDHFKSFNDSYGHDIGDQVLKMVAARIARVGGGGKAYRYGGEEFTILFPGKSSDKAIPHLEALRREIAAYTLALRAKDRPAQAESGKKQRGRRKAEKAVSVTISIGVAERNDRLDQPDEVIRAADKALYRAKNRGRNRVSR